MTDPATIFQRTHTGREEIHQKSHGLTQSERLVLIMVDGVSSYKEIRAKLPVLTDERFERALQKLQLKELVLEVFMPLEGQSPDELERTVIDRFLQQDPMDPLTVILHDPEDELGMLSQSRQPAQSPASNWKLPEADSAMPELRQLPPDLQPVGEATVVVSEIDASTPPVSASTPTHVAQVEPTLDAHDVMAADALSAELRAKWASKPMPGTGRPQPKPQPDPVMIQESQELSPFVAVHWGYWLIVSGLSFIVGFVLARLTS